MGCCCDLRAWVERRVGLRGKPVDVLMREGEDGGGL